MDKSSARLPRKETPCGWRSSCGFPASDRAPGPSKAHITCATLQAGVKGNGLCSAIGWPPSQATLATPSLSSLPLKCMAITSSLAQSWNTPFANEDAYWNTQEQGWGFGRGGAHRHVPLCTCRTPCQLGSQPQVLVNPETGVGGMQKEPAS